MNPKQSKKTIHPSIHRSIHPSIQRCVLHFAYNLFYFSLFFFGGAGMWLRGRGQGIVLSATKNVEKCASANASTYIQYTYIFMYIHTNMWRSGITIVAVVVASKVNAPSVAARTFFIQTDAGGSLFHFQLTYQRSSLTTAHEWMAHAHVQTQTQTQTQAHTQAETHTKDQYTEKN